MSTLVHTIYTAIQQNSNPRFQHFRCQCCLYLTNDVIAAKPGARRAWPATLPEQVKAVAEILTAARAPLADDAIAACFSGRGAWKKRLPQIIDTLVAVGRARRGQDGLAVIA